MLIVARENPQPPAPSDSPGRGVSCQVTRVFIKNPSSRRKVQRYWRIFWMRLHVWVKNSHRLPIISRRILHSKQWIVRSAMPNEHPEIHYKSRRMGKKFLAIWKQGIPSFWNLYSKSTVVQTLLQCGWWNFSPLHLPAGIIKTEFSILPIHLRVSLTLTLLHSRF